MVIMREYLVLAILVLVFGNTEASIGSPRTNKFARKANLDGGDGNLGKSGRVSNKDYLRGKNSRPERRRAKKQKRGGSPDNSYDGFQPGKYHKQQPKKFKFGPWFNEGYSIPDKKLNKKPKKKPKKPSSSEEEGVGPGGGSEAPDEPIPDPATLSPTNSPTPDPTPAPTTVPPTIRPTSSAQADNGGAFPTSKPTATPTTVEPTAKPTISTTTISTVVATASATTAPAPLPTPSSTVALTLSPSLARTADNTFQPAMLPPTDTPTSNPSLAPTADATLNPTMRPTTNAPTPNPSLDPTPLPTLAATAGATLNPTDAPTPNPSLVPTPLPTLAATAGATLSPTDAPTPNPSSVPTPVPSQAATPDATTASPTVTPSVSATPLPTHRPTTAPTVPATPSPSFRTLAPTVGATSMPTPKPTSPPTEHPTVISPPPTVPPVSTSEPSATMTEDIVEVLKSYSRNGGSEFDDAFSYQSIALEWLTGSDAAYSIERNVQRYVLACIYYATNGVANEVTGDGFVDAWGDETNWLSDESECTWFGISCNADDMVATVDLYSNNMTGSFPYEIVILKDTLIGLDVFDNLMLFNEGEEGTNFLGELTKLTYLMIGDTSFDYPGIPPGIGQLTDLVDLDVSYCFFYGELDGRMFSNMDKLEYLILSGNDFNSPIPREIGQLPSLQYLYVEDSFVQGDLSFLDPTALGKIAEIWIDDNLDLEGPIPTSIAALENLAVFSASGCGLSGAIPSELGLLKNIEQLTLYSNFLTGTVPSEIGLLANLDIFEFDGNGISGSVPQEICDVDMETLTADCADDGSVECSCCTDCY